LYVNEADIGLIIPLDAAINSAYKTDYNLGTYS